MGFGSLFKGFTLDGSEAGFSGDTFAIASGVTVESALIPATSVRRIRLLIEDTTPVTGLMSIAIRPYDKAGVLIAGVVSFGATGTAANRSLIISASAVPGEQWFHNVGVAQGANAVGPPLPAAFVKIALTNGAATSATINKVQASFLGF